MPETDVQLRFQLCLHSSGCNLSSTETGNQIYPFNFDGTLNAQLFVTATMGQC